MRVIPLDTVPNQQLSVTLDGNRWVLCLKVARGVMAADVTLNDNVLLQGQRLVAGTPVLPYRYLQGFGNFLLLTNDDLLPAWQAFGTTQVLLYASPEELAALPRELLQWPSLKGMAVETFDVLARITSDGQRRITIDGQFRIVSL